MNSFRETLWSFEGGIMVKVRITDLYNMSIPSTEKEDETGTC